ncbi:FtsK/SpoIIIE domain-containing protein [Arthrobacter sp. ISL-69]|uniref:FtsK/SpoIIIE domain-containing protein n=1 Tax=Arthrobacter sp. ISL-69 TaxID=2819113 RepID=UPI001BE958B3|nr:FtsK/SpoIIIE domain-containing protein [Arthrobacter sp. ISL-69]MBT2536278.1 hypothetical protein [Arthrobacter sp. ISL-69]
MAMDFVKSQELFRKSFQSELTVFQSIEKDEARIKALDTFAGQVASQIQTNFAMSTRAWNIVKSTAPLPETADLPHISQRGDLLPTDEVRVLFERAVAVRKSIDKAMFFYGEDRNLLGRFMRQIESYRLSALSTADEIEKTISRKRTAFASAAQLLAMAVDSEHLGQIREILSLQQSIGPTALSGFDQDEWARWEPPRNVQLVNMGTLYYPRPEVNFCRSVPQTYSYPLLLSLESNGRFLYKHDTDGREAAQSAARALILRLLGAFPAGKLNFTIFDPLGLGDAVAPFLALADHNKDFIGGKIWSSAQDLSKQLGELTAHIEHVITRYLRGDYSTIAEYNAAAGEIAENYRVLVVYDFPAQFTEETQFELQRIMENGPRCGVFTIVVSNSGIKANYGVSDASLPALRLVNDGSFSGYPVEGGQLPLLRFDADPISVLGQDQGQQLIDAVVDRVGRESKTASDVSVTLEKTHQLFAAAVEADVRSDIPPDSKAVDTANAATWWKNSTRDACISPVGPSSAREVALLRFDSNSMAGGFLIGRMGSGKSTLLHTYLAGLTMLYPPDELELYLLDFKEGVEFSAYAKMQLPHAVCVAIESEREFGLSVLESVVEEMQRRGKLFRATGGQQTTFANMRDHGGEKLSRIVLVFDEFHVLFSQDDKIGTRSAELMETVIRQGRGFGVHVLLASQTLSGMTAFPRQKIDLLPVRVLLSSTREDADMVLGEANQGWKLISKPGEAVLNAMGGAVEANTVFLGSFEEDSDRLSRLRLLRDKALASGHRRRPIVFEGFKAAELETETPEDFRHHISSASPYVLQFRAGRALTLSGPANFMLRREGGANVLLVARDVHDSPFGIVSTALLSILSGSRAAQLQFVNFLSIDENVEARLSPYLDTGRLELLRPRRLGETLEALLIEMRRRIEEDDDQAEARVLCLYGLHRARDLTSDSDYRDDESESLSSEQMLREILTNGPDVGIHVIGWVESVSALDRRFERETQAQFNHLLGTRMGREDSGRLFDSDAASKLRENQLLYADLDTGAERRMMAYAVADPVWSKDVLQESPLQVLK